MTQVMDSAPDSELDQPCLSRCRQSCCAGGSLKPGVVGTEATHGGWGPEQWAGTVLCRMDSLERQKQVLQRPDWEVSGGPREG